MKMQLPVKVEYLHSDEGTWVEACVTDRDGHIVAVCGRKGDQWAEDNATAIVVALNAPVAS